MDDELRCRFSRQLCGVRFCKNTAPVGRSGTIFRIILSETLFGGGFYKPENKPIEPDLGNASEGIKRGFKGFGI